MTVLELSCLRIFYFCSWMIIEASVDIKIKNHFSLFISCLYSFIVTDWWYVVNLTFFSTLYINIDSPVVCNKWQWTGWLYSMNIYFSQSGDCASKTQSKVPAGLLFAEDPVPSLQMSIFSLCLQRKGQREAGSKLSEISS